MLLGKIYAYTLDAISFFKVGDGWISKYPEDHIQACQICTCISNHLLFLLSNSRLQN